MEVEILVAVVTVVETETIMVVEIEEDTNKYSLQIPKKSTQPSWLFLFLEATHSGKNKPYSCFRLYLSIALRGYLLNQG